MEKLKFKGNIPDVKRNPQLKAGRGFGKSLGFDQREYENILLGSWPVYRIEDIDYIDVTNETEADTKLLSDGK